MAIRTKYYSIFGWISTISIIIIFLGIATTFSINVPNSDDYRQTLQFVIDYTDAQSWGQKLTLVFEQKNEHRIALLRSFLLLDKSLFGKINFTHTIFIGNIFLVLIGFLFYAYFKKDKPEIKHFIPLALVLFVPVFEINTWAAAGFPYNAVSFFILLTPFLLNKPAWIIPAILSAAIATFTFGNGFIAFLIGFPILILNRQYKRLALWAVASLIFIGIYFIGYNFRSGDHSSLNTLLSIPHHILVNFILFFGALFKGIYGDHHIWGLISGSLVIVFTAYLFYTKWSYFKKHPVLLSWILFPILSAILVAISRSSFGLGATTTYRYRTFQAIFFIVLIISFYLTNKPTYQKYFGILLFSSILLYTTRLEDNLNLMAEQKQMLQSGMNHFSLNQDPSMLCHIRPEIAGNLLSTSINKGLYAIPTNILSPSVKACDISGVDNKMRMIIEDEVESERALMIRGWVFMEDKLNEHVEVLWILKSPDQIYCFSAGPNVDKDNIGVQNELGYSIILDKHNKQIVPGEYRLALAMKKSYGGIQSLRYFNRKIQIKH